MSEMTMNVVGQRTTVRAEELSEWIEQGPAPMILDVRSSRAYAGAHVPESESAPVSNPSSLVNLLPTDGLVVLVCDNGALGRKIVNVLRFCGFQNVVSLDGGLREWMACGYEVIGEPALDVASLLQEMAA